MRNSVLARISVEDAEMLGALITEHAHSKGMHFQAFLKSIGSENKDLAVKAHDLLCRQGRRLTVLDAQSRNFVDFDLLTTNLDKALEGMPLLEGEALANAMHLACIRASDVFDRVLPKNSGLFCSDSTPQLENHWLSKYCFVPSDDWGAELSLSLAVELSGVCLALVSTYLHQLSQPEIAPQHNLLFRAITADHCETFISSVIPMMSVLEPPSQVLEVEKRERSQKGNDARYKGLRSLKKKWMPKISRFQSVHGCSIKTGVLPRFHGRFKNG